MRLSFCRTCHVDPAAASPAPPAARHGRLLVECMVAMLLLGITALSLTTASVAMASLGDDALQLAIGQREQGSAASRVLMDPCNSAAAVGASTRWLSTRHRVDETRSAIGPLHRTRIDAQWNASALANTWSRRLHVSTAAGCR